MSREDTLTLQILKVISTIIVF